MNSVFIVIIALPVFVLGYRFFARLLALGPFALDAERTAPAQTHAGDAEFAPAALPVALGHHVASVAGATTITGAMIAAVWGWIPAFLWIVVGTVVAAGTYAMAGLWAPLRFPGESLASLAGRVLGGPAEPLVAGLGLLLLTLLNAALVVLIGQLLAAHPAALLPFWALVPLALVAGRLLPARGAGVTAALALICLAPLIALGQWLPVGLAGTLDIRLGQWTVFTFDPTISWLLLILVYGYYATRQPLQRLAQPRGFLSGVLLAVLLLGAYAAVLIGHPPISAPEFNRPEGGLPAVPWLFLVLTGGALAGFHALVAAESTARQISRVTHLKPVAYGGALGDGLLALSALLIAAAGFGGAEDWLAHYGAWQTATDPGRALETYVFGMARFAGALGVPVDIAAGTVAFVLAALLLTAFETALRIQRRLLDELTSGPQESSPRRRDLLALVALAMVAGVALSQGQGRGGLAWWPLFGPADHLLAVLVLVTMVPILLRLRRPSAPLSALLVAVAVVTLWGVAAQAMDAWGRGEWLRLAIDAVLLIVAAWGAAAGIIGYRRQRAAAQTAGGPTP